STKFHVDAHFSTLNLPPNDIHHQTTILHMHGPPDSASVDDYVDHIPPLWSNSRAMMNIVLSTETDNLSFWY
nr:hypothetical protein [Tanacetum cinerariifolium]